MSVENGGRSERDFKAIHPDTGEPISEGHLDQWRTEHRILEATIRRRGPEGLQQLGSILQEVDGRDAELRFHEDYEVR